MFADEMDARTGEDVMDVGDAAVQRILDRDQRCVDLARVQRGKRVLEGGAGHGLGARQAPRVTARCEYDPGSP